MSIKLKGSTDGSVSLSAPADTSPTGTDITLTLPTDAGSANQFIKNSGTAGTLDYSSMVENSSGNVGFGTAAGSQRIKFSDSSDTVQGFINAQSDNTNGERVTIGTLNDAYLNFYTDGDERVRILSDGKIGIGDNSPDALLVIKGNSDANTTPSIRLKDGTDTREAWISNTGGDLVLNVGGNDNVPHGTIKLFESGLLTFSQASGERFRCDSSGRVGIGSNPGNFDAGADNLVVGSGSGDNGITIYSGSSNLANIYFADGTAGSAVYTGGMNYNHSTNQMALFTNGGQTRMSITSSGNVGIGKTSTSVTTGGTLIVPSGTSQIIASGNNITPLIIGSSDDVTLTLVDFTAGTATPGGSISITSSTSVSYNTSSDYRLKENVVDLDGAIDRVKQLAPKRFNFIVDADRTVDGFLAHEAQTVVPEAVTGAHNEVDDNDNPVYQGIDQAKLVPLLTAALKEAITKIETLETKVAALEAAE